MPGSGGYQTQRNKTGSGGIIYNPTTASYVSQNSSGSYTISYQDGTSETTTNAAAATAAINSVANGDAPQVTKTKVWWVINGGTVAAIIILAIILVVVGYFLLR
jgi:hypothetical protein